MLELLMVLISCSPTERSPGDADEQCSQVFYADADGDGHGDETISESGCEAPDGFVANADDCDDSDPDAHPGATEICNEGIDDDCDGAADDADSALGSPGWYADADGDGYGAGPDVATCLPDPGFVALAGDCDDGDADVHPGAAERCNGIDDDCDPATSEEGVVIGTTPYDSIQEALDDAAEGATITICAGTYYANLKVTRSVVIEGAAADDTVIHGNDEGPVVSVSGSEVELAIRGVTLRNGLAAYVSSLGFPAGGGVQAYDAESLTIEDSVIEQSAGDWGGGVLGPFDGHLRIDGTTVRDNEARDGPGGGVLLFSARFDALEMSDCEITGNTSTEYGAGIVILKTARMPTASITDTLIDGNVGETSGSYGGGLVSEAGELDLSGVTISNNTAAWGAGAYVTGGVVADDHTEVVGNVTTSGGRGGGVFGLGALWTGGVVSDNVADQGGGVWIEGEMQDAVVEGNHADEWGGGIVLVRNSVLRDVQVTGNYAAIGGGGIFVYGHASHGPSIAEACTVTENTAGEHGGAAWIEAGTFESIDNDWGTGATDNDPDDVWVPWDPSDTGLWDDFGVAFEFDGVESFVCDAQEYECE